MSYINFNNYDIAIEPGAGDGSFFNKIPINKIGIDLCPLSDGIIEKDFLIWYPELQMNNILVVGNPPFGKNSSLAVKFFNHSAYFADTIAFILPRTFRKKSIINRLNREFDIDVDIILPIDSFYLPDKSPYSVPCVWQIWNRKHIMRKPLPVRTKHDDFSFVKFKGQADFMFQRVGGNAGLCHRDFSKSDKSHYLIKDYGGVFDILSSITWDCKYDTVGNPSITKDDVICKYDEHVKNSLTSTLSSV